MSVFTTDKVHRHRFQVPLDDKLKKFPANMPLANDTNGVSQSDTHATAFMSIEYTYKSGII